MHLAGQRTRESSLGGFHDAPAQKREPHLVVRGYSALSGFLPFRLFLVPAPSGGSWYYALDLINLKKKEEKGEKAANRPTVGPGPELATTCSKNPGESRWLHRHR